MTLIIIAAAAALIVALNCFYNLPALLWLVVGGEKSDDGDIQTSIRRYREENYRFTDEDFVA